MARDRLSLGQTSIVLSDLQSFLLIVVSSRLLGASALGKHRHQDGGFQSHQHCQSDDRDISGVFDSRHISENLVTIALLRDRRETPLKDSCKRETVALCVVYCACPCESVL